MGKDALAALKWFILKRVAAQSGLGSSISTQTSDTTQSVAWHKAAIKIMRGHINLKIIKYED